jgi:hypothetical protein
MPFLLPLYTFDKVKCRVAALPHCRAKKTAPPKRERSLYLIINQVLREQTYNPE